MRKFMEWAVLPLPSYSSIFRSGQWPKIRWTIKIWSGYYSYNFVLSNCRVIGLQSKQRLHSCSLWGWVNSLDMNSVLVCNTCLRSSTTPTIMLPVLHPSPPPLLQHSHHAQTPSGGCKAYTQPQPFQKGYVWGENTERNSQLEYTLHFLVTLVYCLIHRPQMISLWRGWEEGVKGKLKCRETRWWDPVMQLPSDGVSRRLLTLGLHCWVTANVQGGDRGLLFKSAN